MCVLSTKPSRRQRLSFNICLYILYLLIKYYLIYLRTHNIIYAASFDYFTSLSSLNERIEKFIKKVSVQNGMKKCH